MDLKELIQKANQSRRKRPSDEEHKLQVQCVRNFRYTFPEHQHCLFAVPNGGKRDAKTAARLKDEGVVPGVSDLILLVPSDEYHALLIEMKTPNGRQSESQKQWENIVTKLGYKYVICRSLIEFSLAVLDYLQNRTNHEPKTTTQNKYSPIGSRD